MTALPLPTPVTDPVPLTLATEGARLVQVTVWPLIGFPAPSRTTALNANDCPTPTLPYPGVTRTAVATEPTKTSGGRQAVGSEGQDQHVTGLRGGGGHSGQSVDRQLAGVRRIQQVVADRHVDHGIRCIENRGRERESAIGAHDSIGGGENDPGAAGTGIRHRNRDLLCGARRTRGDHDFLGPGEQDGTIGPPNRVQQYPEPLRTLYQATLMSASTLPSASIDTVVSLTVLKVPELSRWSRMRNRSALLAKRPLASNTGTMDTTRHAAAAPRGRCKQAMSLPPHPGPANVSRGELELERRPQAAEGDVRPCLGDGAGETANLKNGGKVAAHRLTQIYAVAKRGTKTLHRRGRRGIGRGRRCRNSKCGAITVRDAMVMSARNPAAIRLPFGRNAAPTAVCSICGLPRRTSKPYAVIEARPRPWLSER